MKSRSIPKFLRAIASLAAGLAVLGTAATGSAQRLWEPKAPMPTPRSGHAVARVGDVLVAIGGDQQGRPLDTVEIYDPELDRWRPGAPMPTPRELGGANAAVVGTTVYVIGGRDPVGCSAAFETYDINTDTWDFGPPLPTPRCGLSVVAHEGVIYALGGRDETGGRYFNALEFYDPSLGQWQTAPSLPTPRSDFGAAVLEDEIYLIGGVTDGGASAQRVEAYSPFTRTWAQKPTLPSARSQLAAAATKGLIYAIGGAVGREVSGTVDIYNPKLGRWISGPQLDVARRAFTAISFDGSIYVGGGIDSSGIIGGISVYLPTFTPRCDAAHLVDQSFSQAGTRWRFCYEHRPTEGLVVYDAAFTHRNGSETQVLWESSISNVFVVYHEGTVRYRDLTVATAGLGANRNLIDPLTCATTLDTWVCKEVKDRGFSYHNATQPPGYPQRYVLGQEVSIWMTSQLGAYNYITEWAFKDDGSIEPRVGSTGTLQQYATPPAPGLGTLIRTPPATTAGQTTVGVAHVHNVFFRIDLDIGKDTPNAVEALNLLTPYTDGVAPCDLPGKCARAGTQLIPTEAMISPYQNSPTDPVQTWRVFNKKWKNGSTLNGTIGYELIPAWQPRWQGEITNTSAALGEHWTEFDLYFTRYHACERLAFDNRPGPYVVINCPRNNVRDMVDGESLNGTDVVAWYTGRFVHLPRSEDSPYMPTEWLSFELQPRGWRDKNPIVP